MHSQSVRTAEENQELTKIGALALPKHKNKTYKHYISMLVYLLGDSEKHRWLKLNKPATVAELSKT
jgi:hypothetical protein